MNYIDDIKRFNPMDEQEINDKKIILDFIKNNDNILLRENEVAHITSSGFIVNKNRDKTLMIHHNIYNSWAWTGGHADGDSDLLSVAIKEAMEETNIKNVKPISDEIMSIDILSVNGHIKRGKYVSTHLHLSVAYLLECDEDEYIEAKLDENSGVKWIKFDEVKDLVTEEHMMYLYDKLISKAKGL